MAKRKKQGPLAKRARRDVGLAFRPELREIDRAEDRARDDYSEADARIQEIYNTLSQNLAPLQGQYDTQAQQIAGDLSGQLSGMSSMMGITPAMTGAGAEGQAAAQAFAGVGAGGMNLLASDRSRNLGYQTSTQRQAELDRANLRKMYLEDMRDFVADLGERRLDIRRDMKGALIQRLDELRDQRFSRNLQTRELDIAETQFNKNFKLDKSESNASRKFAQDQIDFSRTQAEKQGDRRRIAPIRDAITGLRSDIAGLQQEGGIVGGAMQDALSQKQRQLARKRKRIKKIRRRDNPNY